MKLDLLCELNLLAEKLEAAALGPKYMFYQIEDPEEIENSIYKTISLLDNAIEILKGYLSPECTFIMRFYYELQANVLESSTPTKITDFYDERIKDIMQHIEDDEDNFTQTEHILAYLRNNHNKGLISESAKEEIERKCYYLAGLWLELFDWILGDLESIKTGSLRPKRVTIQTKAKKARNKELNQREINGLEKLLKNQTNIEFVKKQDGKYAWVHSVKETSMAYFVNCLYHNERARWEGIEKYFGVANLRTTPYLPENKQISEDSNDWRHAMTIALRS